MSREHISKLATLMSMAVDVTKKDLRLNTISPGEVKAIEQAATFYGADQRPSFGFFVATWLIHVILDERVCKLVRSQVLSSAQAAMERKLLEEKEGERNG